MSEPNLVQCSQCGRTYDRDRLGACPVCAFLATFPASQEGSNRAPNETTTLSARREGRENQGKDNATPILEEILETSRKTMHAMRSVARFLMIMVTTSLIGGAAITLGVLVAAWPVVVIGSIVTLIGYIVAIADAWSELNQSN